MRPVTLTPDEWSRVWPCFALAAERGPEEADRIITSLGGSAALRDEVRRMLRWADADDDFLEPLSSSPAPEIPGFDVVQGIGAGGMGTVYEARQHDPPRRVALKVMRPALRADHFRSRFRREAELLARLRHPGIAQVFVAGADPVPFIAMEFLDAAEAITTYCRVHRVAWRERLDLLAGACDAVQHAHQHGIIHLDLKPANVLVDPSVPLGMTGLPQPKVIDFGIARLREDAGGGPVLGSVGWMAPEQREPSTSTYDARADVYAMGVMLGDLMHDRLVRDRRLRAVIARATAHSPDDRYATALDLARDIRACRADRPIAALPSAPRARLALWVRRQPVVAALVGLLAAVVLGATAVTAGLAVRNARLAHGADAARATADEVSRLLSRYLVAADLGAPPVPDVTLRDRLDRVTDDIIADLADAPDVAWRVRHVVGRAYARVGAYDTALRHLGAALAVAPRDAVHRILLDRADVSLAQRDYAAAEADVKAVLTEAERDGPLLALAEGRLGMIRHGQGQRAEALEWHRAGLARLRDRGDSPSLLIDAERALLDTLREENRLDEAMALAEDLVRRAEATFGPTDVRTLLVIDEHGRVLRKLGRHADAFAQHERAWSGLGQRLGISHPRTARAANNAGRALENSGQPAAAEAWYRRAYDARLVSLGADHHETAAARFNLVGVLRQLGRDLEAAQLHGTPP